MARARNIKPGLFKNEVLGQADPLLTILFAGLWCLADREGRLEDRPVRIKSEVLSYRYGADPDLMLNWLDENGFIRRYEVNGKRFIQILEFKKHQNPHKNEVPSEIPSPDLNAPRINGCNISSKIGTTPDLIGSARADSLSSDSLFSDSLNTPLPPQGEAGKPAKLSRAAKKAQKLGAFPEWIVSLVGRLMEKWPTTRADGSPVQNDDVKAAERIEAITAEFPDITEQELETIALEWIATKPTYPNGIHFWFGVGKPGQTPPWKIELRGYRTRNRVGA